MTENNLDQNLEIQDRFALLLLISLTVGFLFDFLFVHDIKPAFSILIFTLSVFISFIIYHKDKFEKKNLEGWILSSFTFIISSTYFIFDQNDLFMLNMPVLLCMIPFSLMVMAKSNRYRWYSISIIEDISMLIAKTILSFFYSFSKFGKLFQKKNDIKKSNSVVKKILIGVLISSPLLGVILMLLSSADQQFLKVFENTFKGIVDWFRDFDMQRLLFHGFIIMFVFFIILSYFWALRKRSKIEKSHLDIKINAQFDSVIVATVLVLLNIVYILFINIQSDYLFKTVDQLAAEGINYSGSARKSFFELVVVAIINISIVLSVLHFLKKEKSTAYFISRISLVLIILESFVLLYSSHFTLSLYEEALGLTFLRIFSHSFVIFVMITLFMLLYRTFSRLNFLRWSAYLALIWYLAVNFINIDGMIADRLITRYNDGRKVDFFHVHNLSADAYPALIDFLKMQSDEDIVKLDNKYPFFVSELLRKREHFERLFNKSESWRGWNLSRLKALDKLKENSKLFDNIKLKSKRQ